MQDKLKAKLESLVREREELLLQLEILSEDWNVGQERHVDLSADVQLLRAENGRLLENVRSARKALEALPEGQAPKQTASSRRRIQSRKTG